ncbi:hypothetical protein ACLOJK_028548 [Asimina triloba]
MTDCGLRSYKRASGDPQGLSAAKVAVVALQADSMSTGNDFIELTNGARKAKAELPCELVIPNALDKDRHVYFSEEA